MFAIAPEKLVACFFLRSVNTSSTHEMEMKKKTNPAMRFEWHYHRLMDYLQKQVVPFFFTNTSCVLTGWTADALKRHLCKSFTVKEYGEGFVSLEITLADETIRAFLTAGWNIASRFILALFMKGLAIFRVCQKKTNFTFVRIEISI